MQSEEEHFVEIILDDVGDRLVTNVISLITEHTNFGWGFKDKEEEELKNLLYTYNVLDKFNHEIFGQKVQIQNQMMNQVPNISFCNFDKVKTIKHMLDKFVNEVDGLGLKIVNSNPKNIPTRYRLFPQ